MCNMDANVMIDYLTKRLMQAKKMYVEHLLNGVLT